MRKALIVGINHYQAADALYGCIDDAHSLRSALARHSDGTVNFAVELLTGSGPNDVVLRASLKDKVASLFSGDSDIALFYFAGHGHIEATGGYLLASDSVRGDEGLPLGELLALANASRARNKVILLDSCHSGIAGSPAADPRVAQLTEGLTILTASTAAQYAKEGAEQGSEGGVFTTLLLDALNGAAANLVGDITPGSVYAHIDQSLGPWDQRPVFKTNVTSFVSLKKVQPPISLPDLQRIVEFFPTRGGHFQLDPTFEPQMKGRDPGMALPILENTLKFSILQSYNRLNLLVPVDAPHMWDAAMECKTCRLTVLGEHYRRLVERGRL